MMTYVLVYRDAGGPHFTPGLATLDAVNDEISRLNGARVGLTIKSIEEERDGPRTWAIEYPPVPPAGTRVQDKYGSIRTVGKEGALRFKGEVYSWKGALEIFGPLTEVVETEVQAAARRLRERLEQGSRVGDQDADLVLRHVLSGGQL